MRREKSRSIDRELLRAVEELARRLKPAAIILFGSRARGDWGPWSDYDLLVLAEFREPYLERIALILEALRGVKLPVEPHPYTLREALEMLRRGNPIIVDALEEGVVLYATRDLDKLLEEYREMKKRGLKRTKTSIIVPSKTL